MTATLGKPNQTYGGEVEEKQYSALVNYVVRQQRFVS
jgi:hypothetical protein